MNVFSSRMDVNLVRFDNVSLKVDGRVLVEDVNFTMNYGEHVGIIGPSGAGKSTLLNLLLGFLQPSSGKVSVLGKDLSGLDKSELEDLRMKMGMLFQSNALFFDWTVFENIAFPVRYHYSLPESVLQNIVMLKLDAVGLRGTNELMPSQLSGGMARRVALARAITMDPQFLIYDEPFTGQDPVTKSSLKYLLKRIREKNKVSSITVSHDIRDLSEIVDKMVVLKEGKIVAEGSADEIMHSKDPDVALFIQGESELKQAMSDKSLMEELVEGGNA